MAMEQEGGTARRRYRSAGVALGGAALLAAGLAGCASDSGDYSDEEADYAQVCVNESTGERVEDAGCDDPAYRSTHGLAWFFIPAIVGGMGGRGGLAGGSGVVPPVGASALSSGGSFTEPKSGSVSRGGFGSRGSGSFGG